MLYVLEIYWKFVRLDLQTLSCCCVISVADVAGAVWHHAWCCSQVLHHQLSHVHSLSSHVWLTCCCVSPTLCSVCLWLWHFRGTCFFMCTYVARFFNNIWPTYTRRNFQFLVAYVCKKIWQVWLSWRVKRALQRLALAMVRVSSSDIWQVMLKLTTFCVPVLSLVWFWPIFHMNVTAPKLRWWLLLDLSLICLKR